MEQSLHKADLASFVEASPDALLIVDSDGTIRTANTAATDLLGYEQGDLVGTPVSQLVPVAHRAGHNEHVNEYFEHRQKRPMGTAENLTALRRDGTEIPVDISLAPVAVDDEIMVTAVLRDLTEAKRASSRRARKEARLAQLFSSPIVGAAVLELATGRLQGANDTFLGFIGRDRDTLDAGGVRWDSLTPAAGHSEDRKAFQRLAAAGAAPPYETELLRPDGSRLAVSVAGSIAPANDQQAVMVVVDRSAKRTAEEKLARTTQRLEDSQRVAHVGSAEWEPLENRAWWTEEMYHLFDVPPSAGTLTYQKILERIHPDDRERVDTILREAAHDGSAFEFEHRVIHRDGKVRWLRNRGSYVAGGQDRRLVGVSQDITDQKEAEEKARTLRETKLELEKLAEMSEFRTRFVNMAAHELKNPLSPMAIELHLLGSGELGPLEESQQESLARIQRSYDRLNALIQDMLDAVRLQADALSLTVEPIDASALVRDAVDLFRNPAEQDDLDLAANVEPGLTVALDARRIHQVLTNLLANAIKFTPAGGRVRVTARAEGEAIRVQVADTGMGMTPADASHLFQPFTQIHDKPTKGVHGTGLGLYVSKGIIEQHGGQIGASSAGPGQGSTFWFKVPRKPTVVPLNTNLPSGATDPEAEPLGR